MPGRAALTRRARATAQLLAVREPRTPVQIVGHLLAVQAQDLRSAKLALWARGSGFGASDVDAALSDGSLVVSWLLRGTLHLVRAEDWPWLHALTAPRQRAASARRLGQLGVSPQQAERAVGLIADALADGPRSREDLAGALAAAGIPTEGQATPHLLGRASIEGVLVGCGEHLYRLAPETAGVPVARGAGAPGAADAPDAPDAPAWRDEMLATLATRYLRAHAPAGDADLAAWSGVSLGVARRGLALAGLAAPRDTAAEPIPPRVLPAFDPYLLGWKDRSFAVPPKLARVVHPGGGMLRAVTTDDGLVTGTWSLSDPPDPGIKHFLAT